MERLRRVQERWDTLLERIGGWPCPRPADAERLLSRFIEEMGVEPTLLDDALGRLEEYREKRREDFETAEEYQEAWEELLSALDEVELEMA